MPDESRDISPADFVALNSAAVEALEGKYGLSIRIRARSAALAAVLKEIEKISPTGPVSEYDRGFDRTSPGYDKYYDRDRSAVVDIERFDNPGELRQGPMER